MAAETAPATRHWATQAEAADALRCSVKTVRRMVARGEIYAERIGSRMIRVDLASIQGRPLGSPKAARR